MQTETQTQNLVKLDNLLDIDSLKRAEIEIILDHAVSMEEVLNRDIKKVPSLRGKTIVTLFYESSTRTRVSFEQAGKILSADVININNKTSSNNKGESLYNTALTIQAIGADVVIIRHPHSGAPHFISKHIKTSVINAGDGTHAHPTQALLDLYTIKKKVGSIEGKNIVLVGDILYSRVARSHMWGLSKLGANITICGPETLIPNDFIKGLKNISGHPFNNIKITSNIDEGLKNADIVMALRLQLERQQSGHLPSLREYSREFGITEERLKKSNQNVIVMHPGPMNEGIEIESNVAHGVNSIIEEQVTSGVALRMALLNIMCSK
ncbi:MAG: aspartate carbamoyltransferase catalytic subunit [SAR202 cluster bacterium]|nr:aspartate carbamoyltransferase [Chloroflexota bacterium]MQG22384.1 aspartate carbamoyltransferase catalytic subunit [SAR202 cluster bacterium]|tara:strand:- start:587 stop:1558 length:972 start_codon:yes stop_codon:yes gene_type:complete